MNGYRGIFPGAFTMGNVVSGFIAILSTFEGHITEACWFVLLAAFFDALDGKVARLSGSTSQFGVELDSLADFLSFGVAPAVIVYAIKLSDLGRWGWIISIVFIMAAAYRLARYNVMAEEEEKKDFVGLPVPMAATCLVAFIIFSYHIWGQLEYGEFLVSLIVLCAFLMVSQVQYDAIPERFDTKTARVKLIVLLVAGATLILGMVVGYGPRHLLFPFLALYILFGVVREFYRLFTVGYGKVTGRQLVRPRMRRHKRLEKHEHD